MESQLYHHGNQTDLHATNCRFRSHLIQPEWFKQLYCAGLYSRVLNEVWQVDDDDDDDNWCSSEQGLLQSPLPHYPSPSLLRFGVQL